MTAKAAGNNTLAKEAQDRAKAFRSAYDDLCDKTGLQPTPERMAVSGDNRKSVEKSVRNDIIKERTNKVITPITDKAIENVPRVEINGYTDAQITQIQNAHKELLRYAKDENDSNEAAFVFDRFLLNRSEFKGSDTLLEFGTGLMGKGNDLFVMHNHPRNSSYSDYDIAEFVNSDIIRTMTIVKNNGGVEALTKTSSYDKKAAVIQRERCKRKYVSAGTDKEYEKAIHKLLMSLEKKGMIAWIK